MGCQWHRHPADYVVMPLKGGMLTVEASKGASAYLIETGQSYARPAGVEHNIANDTDEEISFVEVEVLDRQAWPLLARPWQARAGGVARTAFEGLRWFPESHPLPAARRRFMRR